MDILRNLEWIIKPIWKFKHELTIEPYRPNIRIWEIECVQNPINMRGTNDVEPATWKRRSVIMKWMREFVFTNLNVSTIS